MKKEAVPKAPQHFCLGVLSPPILTDFNENLAIGRNNRRLAVWFSYEAGRENLQSSGSHGIRISGIKGGNTPGSVLLLLVLAVAVAGAKAGVGVGGQPGRRSPRLVSSYVCCNE